MMENENINGYVLKYKLGDGGMAEVWYAENGLQKPAAVKVLLKKLCDEAEIVTRFENEARLMVHLNHPHIRNIQDYGTINGRPCMVMEYLEGMDLSRRMKTGEKFGNDQLIKWWNDLVDALQYTHRKNIIHRDIKPSNLFVTETGSIKLLDFGVAKIKDNITVTQTGSRMGTLMYMSPEQVYDVKNLTYKTDAYSLAVTFYHLVTGAAPYDNTKISDFEIQENIVRKDIDISVLPQPWRDLLPRYFYKNPAERQELKKIDDGPMDYTGETIFINPQPANTVQEQVPKKVENNTVSPAPLRKREKHSFYILIPIAIIIGLIVFALNRDKISKYFAAGEHADMTTAKKTASRSKPVPVEKPSNNIPQPDTITSPGADGGTDQVIVNPDMSQREGELKDIINNYYRSRINCSGLSGFFDPVVVQYYNKSNVSLTAIQKECENYHKKWQFIEADIDADSYVFSHRDGNSYVDFNMLYKIKQNEQDEWIPYNIDVSMMISTDNKIQRIVERRIEKL